MKLISASRRAVAFLSGYIERCRAGKTVRLPVYSKLAAMAGVAPATMLKAVKELQREGVLLVSQGKGIRIRDAQPAQVRDVGPVPLTISQRLHQRILDDIERGQFLPGDDAPTLRDLLSRYAVTFGTLRNALAWFEQRRVLRRDGRRFCVDWVPARGNRLSVVLVAAGDSTGRIELMTPRTQGIVHAIGYECLRQGLDLKTRPYDYANGSFVKPLRAVLREAGAVGVIVLPVAIPAEHIVEIAAEAAAHRKALAIYDEAGDAMSGLPAPGVCLVESVATQRPGREVARYLMENGHRRIAYLSANHDTPSSLARLAGLQQECALTGGSCEIVPIASRGVAARGDAAALNGAIEAVVGRAAEHAGRAFGGTPNSEHLLKEIGGTVVEIFRVETLCAEYRPLFDRACDDRSLTAWVTFNDRSAVAALSYLRQKQRQVPHDVSVVGFDDSHDAFVNELSSYNFNDTGAARAMLAHLLSPRRELLSARHARSVAIEGFVNRRESVRRVAERAAGP